MISPLATEAVLADRDHGQKTPGRKPCDAERGAVEKAEAIAELKKILKPGDTVYSVLRHVSASGMSRRIDFYALVTEDRKPRLRFLSGYIARAVGLRRHPRKDGLVVGGCGMDAGFHVVYELGATMWPKGTAKPHGTRNGEPDTDGGYALRHEWI